ncbi:GPI ethanolamine phosphate transferase 2 [Wickerhamiella sorbophila]|uniref:GPI ethanolamine phosphate transferase 2 n=1 Tax=Wickerhamiella sorbophila TaxID=45607 RepID=A0A2T0FBZ3_9ASCO|nr:GPI ethanolamine phosphate transferase 2 [Wickerhamiella sorbophila]PRT52516.1 GPI ethanolamine phosphate transferase 2 [Wickerhamiella sorbophila]
MLWLVTLLLQVSGLLLFLRGFFPSKTVEPGYNQKAIDVPPKFDRMVFMVVDALRSDFMFSNESSFETIHSLIREGCALPFTAYSNPPTVTLPRLKGITTGSTPNFLDAVLNIAESDTSSTLKNQDSWISQLKQQGKSMHMFGDDTWIKLFPGIFDVTDGTSSFYVSDFTEVDHNVTRHLDEELATNKWDVLILHYLGLDHIGHKGGPRSPFMEEKQKEMDSIIKMLYGSLDESTLLVVMGDHGMNDVGNHGGSSAGETSAALAMISRGFDLKQDAPLPYSSDFTFYDRVKQIDLVPTLSLLLGLPIPRNSLGVLIPAVKSLWTEIEQSVILKDLCSHFDGRGVEVECTEQGLLSAQGELMQASSEYVEKYMITGVLLLILSAIVSVWCTMRLHVKLRDKTAMLVFSLVYASSMFGSSTVEEEHQFWFWCTSALLVYGSVTTKTNKLEWVMSLVILRVFRGWRHPGQKWPEGPDFTRMFQDHSTSLWLLILVEYFHLFRRLRGGLLGSLAVIGSLVYKASTTYYGGEYIPSFLARFVFRESRLDGIVQIVYIMCGLLALIKTVNGTLSVELLELILVTQSRPSNIPLLLLSHALRRFLKRTDIRTNSVASTLICMSIGYSLFFASGGSNSLATVDLGNAYNGVGSYNVTLVGLLTFVSNWVGPIYWAVVNRDLCPDLRMRFAVRQLFYTIAMASICFACLLLKGHLFIWTVFSPKLLYATAWLLFQHGLVETVCPIIFDRFMHNDNVL